MKIYNLTSQPLAYKGHMIPANGGCITLPDNTFIPTRDRKLIEQKKISIGNLPAWWLAEQALKLIPPPTEPKAVGIANCHPEALKKIEYVEPVAQKAEIIITKEKSKK